MSVSLRDSKGRIMLVEDNQNLRKVLKDYLETIKFKVSDFSDGDSALNSFEKNRYDLCLFDVVMVGMSGFDLLKSIREIDELIPVVFLTARTDKEDKIKAFKMGCDDYITKPFSTEELVLRIEAILRRTRQPAKVKPVYKATNEVYHFGQFTFNHANLELSHPLQTRTLTRKEAELLRLLCEHINCLVPRSDILRKIWGNEDYASSRSMDVFLTKLRSYLAIDPIDPKYLNTDPTSRNKYVEGYEPDIEIKNIHGAGFMLKSKFNPTPEL